MACLYMFVFPNDAFFMEKSMLSMLGTTHLFFFFFLPCSDHMSMIHSVLQYTHIVVMRMANGYGYMPSLQVPQLIKGVSNTENFNYVT